MIKTTIKEIDLEFKTSDQVFSPKSIDPGTLAMLSLVEFNEEDYVLDLGCGYGVVGILVAKIIGDDHVIMVDVDESAVSLSKQNAILNHVDELKIYQSDGLKDINEKDFTLILSNPPYHADFSVPKAFIEKGFNRLVVGGRLFMVTKRKEWYKNKIISIFGGVKIHEIDGYYIFMAEKKTASYANKKPKNKKIKNKKKRA